MEACIYVSSRAPPRYLRGISLVKNGMLGKSLPPLLSMEPKIFCDDCGHQMVCRSSSTTRL